MITDTVRKILIRDFILCFFAQFTFTFVIFSLLPTLPIYLSRLGSQEVDIGVLGGKSTDVPLTSLAFGTLHGICVLIPVLVLLGLLLAGLRRLSGGLLAPVIAHVINNLLGLLLTS